jgi:protein-tyrosine phosphatase
MARTLAQNNQIFCLGSDIHPGRKYRMKTAEKKLNKLIDSADTCQILYKNPEQLIEPCPGAGNHSRTGKIQGVINF